MRLGTNIALLLCWTVAERAHAADTLPAPNPASTGRPAVLVPPLPKSPLAEFRELLALTPQELERVLGEKPEPLRVFLKAKLGEYTALTPQERELRLRATELRWYLRPLMALTPTNRTERLTTVPEDYRRQVEERLKQWDLLAADVQKDVLENERTIHFLRLEASTARARDALNDLAPEPRRRLESELKRWTALPPERRQRMFDHFQKFFELSPQEKAKTLEMLSSSERQEMERTLRGFETLPPEQRRDCLNSFRKFANMTPAERASFLNSVERWKALTAAERETWRKLSQQLPPLPPGAVHPPLPPVLPPLPITRPTDTNAGG